MKKFLSLVMALALTLSLVTISAGAKDFTDDSKITYGEAVDVISAIGVVDGYTNGSFNPTATLTRGAAAKIICNLILGPTTAGSLAADAAPFKDVAANHVFAGYIAYCANQGIINGYADGTFRPAGTVTGYQFMKMLLGALGYDGSVEGFTGSNWTVNVAKLAVSIGLDDGNDSFVGTAAMTREEACLYAYNTLNATMVEYDSTGTSIVVGDTTITSGASKASDVANNATTETIKNDNYMQFAEKYFTKLTKSTGNDDFMRPATTWKYKNDKIGTYADEADVTYTEQTKAGTIYSDLGLSSSITATCYRNGDADTALAVSKGSSIKTTGGNGTLTEVYYDSDAGTIRIVEIDTYAAEVSGVKAATSTADRYVTLSALSTTPTGFSSNNTFETEDFAEDDIVLYTFANNEVQSLAAAQSVSGDLKGIVAAKSLTLDSDTYKYSAKANATADSTPIDSDVTAYLDAYGYAIYTEITKEATSNYAYVLATGTGTFSDTYYAKLLLADGTVSQVETKTLATQGLLVTYTVNSSKQYVLTPIATGTDYTYNTMKTATPPSASTTFSLKNGYAAITVATGSYIYANSKSVFVVKSGTVSDPTYTAYTGIANVPSISGTVGISYYCKNTGMITFAVIDATAAGASIETSTSSVVFVDASSKSALSTNSDSETYYTYDAVVNGTVSTIKVSTSLNTNGFTAGVLSADAMFTGVTYNTNDIATAFSTNTKINNNLGAVAGTGKLSGDAIKLGGVYYTVADDANVYYVDYNDGLEAYTIGSVQDDVNDKCYFIYDDGEVTNLVVVEVPSSVATYSATVTNVPAGATVTAGAYTANVVGTTATFSAIPAGTYTVSITETGYAPQTATLTVNTSNTGTVAALDYYAVTCAATEVYGLTVSANYSYAYAGATVIATVSGTAQAGTYYLKATANSATTDLKTAAVAAGAYSSNYTYTMTGYATQFSLGTTAEV